MQNSKKSGKSTKKNKQLYTIMSFFKCLGTLIFNVVSFLYFIAWWTRNNFLESNDSLINMHWEFIYPILFTEGFNLGGTLLFFMYWLWIFWFYVPVSYGLICFFLVFMMAKIFQ